ncbi:histidine kinase dimerization/phosphoacceptor domain -containing protein [Sandarakinorhabdus sp.]|uniref:sensor histidine kinase n=1 Tax=Sandarakinorhabdus sp. TaxID=1916663 RepID=UPI00286E1429|nr:histidine kinase dimerization/phosphoacceptor domain -containing protein [Sandarakinorhabdus sp.]
MTSDESRQVDALLETPDLSGILDDDRYRHFLDNLPVAIAVSALHPFETVTYANLQFQLLTGRDALAIEGKSWRLLSGVATAEGDDRLLREAVEHESEYIGEFTINSGSESINVDVWSNTIENDDGEAVYRLVAMGRVRKADSEPDHAAALRSKDTLLKELQHRVKNNLQMITALIRLETRTLPDDEHGERFERLAGRINALAALYDALSTDRTNDQIDLGGYLGQIASSVMQAHAVEGIRLDTKIDTWPVSINLAMPAGLVVNEVLTNSLKHAFIEGKGGVIKLHSLIDDEGCHITIADDGVGLSENDVWPRPGKLSAIIVRSLEQNAGAKVRVISAPAKGVCVTISFAKHTDFTPATETDGKPA